MGCDIHCFLEEYIDDKWVFIPCDNDHRRRQDFYDERYYWTFAWLTNCFRARFINPINGNRPIPQDCSKEVRENYEREGNDAHSLGNNTFKELLEFFEVPVNCSGYFSKAYENHLKRENISIMDDENWYKNYWEVNPKFDGTKYEDDRKNYVKLNWTLPIEKVVDKNFINKVKEYSKNKNPEHLRIIFWFDN